MSDNKKYVEDLIKKAAETLDSQDAMRFSQAAANAANALGVLNHNFPKERT